MSHVAFLKREWPDIYDATVRAERAVHFDPRTSCFYARRALELAVDWAFKFDASLKRLCQDNMSALIHDPSFKQAAGEPVFNKTRFINTLGNRAVHGARSVPADDAVMAVRELFHVAYWFARTYARVERPAPDLAFDPNQLPKPDPGKAKQTAEQLRQLEVSLKEKDENLAVVLANRSSIDEELKLLRARD